MMHAWEFLDPNPFQSNGVITSAFVQLGKRTFDPPVNRSIYPRPAESSGSTAWKTASLIWRQSSLERAE
jgi:hypothetical protein